MPLHHKKNKTMKIYFLNTELKTGAFEYNYNHDNVTTYFYMNMLIWKLQTKNTS